jgi:hypothetical protein
MGVDMMRTAKDFDAGPHSIPSGYDAREVIAHAGNQTGRWVPLGHPMHADERDHSIDCDISPSGDTFTSA